MLKHLYVRNFIFIDELELEFERGVVMITGETGAGKSIILGAIDMGLGQRGGQEKVKIGADQAEIILTFDVRENTKAKLFLKDQALSNDDECLLRRIIYLDGRSRNYINGRPVNVSMLRDLSSTLITLHTQHENQLLLSTQGQTVLLDAYAKNQDCLKKIEQCVNQWKNIENDIRLLEEKFHDKQQRLDYLSYQYEELLKANMSETEIHHLIIQHKALTTSQDVVQHYETILYAFSPQDSLGLLDIVYRLKQPAAMAEKLTGEHQLLELVENATIQLKELQTQTLSLINKAELDPEQLERIEERLSELHHLARKHHINLEELPIFIEKIKAEIESLHDCEAQVSVLRDNQKKLEQEYGLLTAELTEKRRKAAAILEKKVTQIIHDLGMPDSLFSIALHQRPATSSTLHLAGLEQIEFLLQANSGHSVMPLKKAASGGELARISLALQATLASYIDIPTLILDEIDVGVGGKVAAMIGQKLRQLGRTHQVICITHQATVAASGNQHFKVDKINNKKDTIVTVKALEPESRIQEIARMIGGLRITDHALKHAREMLSC